MTNFATPIFEETQMKYTINFVIKTGVTNGIIDWHMYNMTFNAEPRTRKESIASLKRWVRKNCHAILEWAIEGEGIFNEDIKEIIIDQWPNLKRNFKSRII